MKSKFCFLWILLFFISGCEEDNSSSPVPNLSFYLEIPLATFPKLNIPGESLTLGQTDARFPTTRIGYRGLIILHSPFTEGEYICFDRACPNDLTQTSIHDDKYMVTCPKCKTKYNIFNYGFPEENTGIGSKEPLKRYTHIAVLSNNRIGITN